MKLALLTLQSWCVLCIEASFPQDERFEIALLASAYMEWLDSLPVLAS